MQGRLLVHKRPEFVMFCFVGFFLASNKVRSLFLRVSCGQVMAPSSQTCLCVSVGQLCPCFIANPLQNSQSTSQYI